MKQRFESEQFIVINDNLKRCARDLYQMGKGGKIARQRRDRERMCVRGRGLWGEKDSVSNKIDC